MSVPATKPITVRAKLARVVTPWVRLATLHIPSLRRLLWDKVITGRLDWRSYRLLATTHFGAVFNVNTSDVIQRYIYFFGCWEPPVEAIIAERLRPGDTFVDIGANIGYFTLFAASRVGKTGRVVSIEASPGTYELLLENLRRNSAIGLVRPIQAAVTDKSSEVKLHLPDEGNLGSASMLREGTSAGFQMVRGEPLGNLLTGEEMSSARMIKIDVEGAEGLVIEGMRPILPRLRSAEILMEITPALESCRAAMSILTSDGWEAYEVVSASGLEPYFERARKPVLSRISDIPSSRTEVLFRYKA